MRKGWLGSKFLGTVFFYNELLIKKKKKMDKEIKTRISKI